VRRIAPSSDSSGEDKNGTPPKRGAPDSCDASPSSCPTCPKCSAHGEGSTPPLCQACDPGEGRSSDPGEGPPLDPGEGTPPTRPHGSFPERVLFSQRFGHVPNLNLHAISQDHVELPLFDPDPCDDCCQCPKEAVQAASTTKISWDDLMKEPESYAICHLT
jgi:hypothetical protein